MPSLVSGVVTIVAYIEYKRADDAITTSHIRAQLQASVDATYRRQKAAAEAIVGDWAARERKLQAAAAQRAAQSERINALAEEFRRIARGPDADSVAKRLARILEEEGPTAALDYIETQRGRIIERIQARRAANRERDRAELEPLLASAGLYATEGAAQQARGLYAQVVELAPHWTDALDAHRWFLIDQGDLAVIRGSLNAAERDFALARRRVDALIALQPEEPRWQHNLGLCLERTGDLKVTRGDLDGAQQDFERSLGIRERLAAAEPGNAGWQRDLAVSYYKLGRVADARGDEQALVSHWRAMLAIFDALDQAGLHISPSDRAGLQAIRVRLDRAVSAAAPGHDAPAAASGGN